MRALLALLAGLVGVVATLVVGVAVAVALVGGGNRGQEECRCAGVQADDATAVVLARVAGRTDDRVAVEVESVERGSVDREDDEVLVRTYDGVGMAPWRRYRLHLFDDGRGPSVNGTVPPEALGLTRPLGLEAFSSLPLLARLGWAAAPALAVSLLLGATTLRRTRARRRRR